MLRIIGDDIEYNGRLVGRLTVPEGTLRGHALEALERACGPEPAVTYATDREHAAALEEAETRGYKDAERDLQEETEGLRIWQEGYARRLKDLQNKP